MRAKTLVLMIARIISTVNRMRATALILLTVFVTHVKLFAESGGISMDADKVRIPKQKRSIEIKNKIKRTAQELFSEKGYYNTSSNDIVKAAGVSIGAFYSYFKDKKALFF